MLAFLRRPFGWKGSSFITYSDDEVHADCLELERLGKIRRAREWPNGRVAWLPVEGEPCR